MGNYDGRATTVPRQSMDGRQTVSLDLHNQRNLIAVLGCKKLMVSKVEGLHTVLKRVASGVTHTICVVICWKCVCWLQQDSVNKIYRCEGLIKKNPTLMSEYLMKPSNSNRVKTTNVLDRPYFYIKTGIT